jgi:hypothetical protein
MKPESITPTAMRDAVRLARASEPSPLVDDETLATLIESGIGAVAPRERAPLLRAIGNAPDLAALVADLAPATQSREVPGAPAVFGIRANAWRIAWAACALLAVGITLWHVGSPSMPEVALLDSAVDGPSQDFADSLHQSLRRKTVILLWALLALLTAPAVLTVRHTNASQRI